MSLLDNPYVADIVALVHSLTDSQIEQVATLLSSGDLPPTAGVLMVQQITHLPISMAAKVVTLLRRWHSTGETSTSLALALLAARATYMQTVAEAPSVQLVWTGPISTPIPTRSTAGVLLDLINVARFEIVIVGYVLTDGASVIFEHLAAAQRRGVKIVIIGNRLEQQLRVLQTIWPEDQQLPDLYSRLEIPDDPLSALHAKLAIADQKQMLVTSANLTYHGLAGNIEIGLQVSGKVISDAITLLSGLIAEGVFIRINAGI